MPSLLAELLAARPSAIALLAARDPAAWQALEQHIMEQGECPPALVLALVETADLDDRFDVSGVPWQRRFRPTIGNPYDDRPGWGFAAWLSAAITRYLPASHVMALRVRFRVLLDDRSADITPRLLDLARDIAAADPTPPHHVLLGLASYTLGCRLGASGDRDAARGHALVARDLFADLVADQSLGVSTMFKRAMGLHASELLLELHFDEAFALAEQSWRYDGPPLPALQLNLPVTPQPFAHPASAVEQAANWIAEGNWHYGRDWIVVLETLAREFHYPAATARVGKIRALCPEDSSSAKTDDDIPSQMR